MATLAQIILIIACIYLAEGRFRIKHENFPSAIVDQKIQEVNKDKHADKKAVINISANNADRLVAPNIEVPDADAIVFPSDEDSKVYPDINKVVDNILNTMNNKELHDSMANIHKEDASVPLLPNVVPAIEAKEVFTNPIRLQDSEEVIFKPIELKKDKTTTPKPMEEPAEEKLIESEMVEENLNTTFNVDELENKNYDTSNANETTPDFSSRFGVTSNYMLVPVNNVQNYQPMQTLANGISVPNTQSQQTYYVANNEGNAITPLVANSALQYATPNDNVASNVGANPQYIPSSINASPNTVPYASSNINPHGLSNGNYNGNFAQGNTNYVPINVPNTYIINGQLYAAVTVPDNVNVPNNLYFVNPQLSGSGVYQVANNLPLYKMVSVGGQPNGVNNVQILQ